MPIKSHLPNLTPSREKFKQEITLLSRGYYAPDAFPDGKITVYPWDSKLDDFLLERGRKGQRELLIYDLLDKIANLNGVKVDAVLVGDAFSILFTSRAMQTDFTVNYRTACPACGKHDNGTVRVPDQLGRIGEKKIGYPGYDEVTLPCTDVVRTRPLTIGDELAIIQRDANTKRQVSDRLARLFTSVVSVNGGAPDDVRELSDWYDALPPLDVTTLRDHISKNEPRLDTRIPHACEDCNHEYTYNLDLNVDFFR